MNKIDKFADYLSENRDDAAALMESLSLIRDSTVQRVLKKHVKQNYAADRPLPWSKILHDIYILMVKREESRKDTERYLVYCPINKWYNKHEPITRRKVHATSRYPHCTQPG